MLRDDYPLGVPCWVDTFQPDPAAAAAFYSAVFGWVFDAPAAGGYLTARLGEHRVAGIGQAPEGAPAFWCTYVRVDRVDFSLAQVAGEGGAVLAGPLSAGAGGSMGVVSDPAGIAFALCDQLGAELVNEPNTWAMGALHTPDLAAAGEFYGALFGWQLEPVPGAPLSLWRLPGYVGGAPGQPIPRDVVAVATTRHRDRPAALGRQLPGGRRGRDVRARRGRRRHAPDAADGCPRVPQRGDRRPAGRRGRDQRAERCVTLATVPPPDGGIGSAPYAQALAGSVTQTRMLSRILSALTREIPTAHDRATSHFHAGPRGPYPCHDERCRTR